MLRQGREFMLKLASLVCDHGHERLAVDFDTQAQNESAAIERLGSLAARLEFDTETTFTACEFCGSTLWRIEIRPRPPGDSSDEVV